MNNDLIERWKVMKLGPMGYCSEPLKDLIADTIAALSPVLPEDAAQHDDNIRESARLFEQLGYEIAAGQLRKSAEYIERLARENELKDGWILDYKKWNGEQQQRIEALEIMRDTYKAATDRQYAQIAEYEKLITNMLRALSVCLEDSGHDDVDRYRTELERIRGMK